MSTLIRRSVCGIWLDRYAWLECCVGVFGTSVRSLCPLLSGTRGRFTVASAESERSRERESGTVGAALPEKKLRGIVGSDLSEKNPRGAIGIDGLRCTSLLQHFTHLQRFLCLLAPSKNKLLDERPG